MVKAIVDLDEHANRVINIIKAKYDLKDKSDAINVMAKRYEEELLDPELKPEYIEKLKKIEKQKTKKIKNFAKEFGIE